jgi:HAD superfamily hydrolase (TIGR01549 family)
MIKLVLFDLDGTLIQTTKIILETFRETFNYFFKNVELSDEEYTNLLGQTLYKTFSMYEEDEKKLEEIISYYRELSNFKIEEGLNAYDGAVEILRYLKKKNIKVGVVTSKMRNIALHHLEMTGLKDYIDHLVGFEDVVKHKPDAEPILKALEIFNAKKETTVYIGDHENDIIAAKNASILSCAVTYSERLKEMLNQRPDFVIDELMNIKDLI